NQPNEDSTPPAHLAAGTKVEIEVTGETVDGKVFQQQFTTTLSAGLIQRGASIQRDSAAAPAGGIEVLAALMGKATTVGEHSVRMDIPMDVEGITEGETRTTVMPVDRYLAARGRLAVYARFNPETSGCYEVAIGIDGREFEGHKIDVISPGTALTKPLTVANFHAIQQQMKQAENNKKAQSTLTKKSAEA